VGAYMPVRTKMQDEQGFGMGLAMQETVELHGGSCPSQEVGIGSRSRSNCRSRRSREVQKGSFRVQVHQPEWPPPVRGCGAVFPAKFRAMATIKISAMPTGARLNLPSCNGISAGKQYLGGNRTLFQRGAGPNRCSCSAGAEAGWLSTGYCIGNSWLIPGQPLLNGRRPTAA